MADPALPIDLGDGLRLRTATPADAEPLADFNAAIHTNDPAQPDQAAASWTRDLLTRPHPTFRADLFTVVDEAASGRIVSSLNLIPQTWSFGGIELGVGRIELVGTDPDFRHRGLVRRQVEVVHRWSEGMGHHAQGITGIPWYYRQFGYEMALDLGGDRRVALGDVPKPTAAGDEPYRLRPATAADAPLLMEADARGRSGRFVSCVRDAALWRYEIDGRDAASLTRVVPHVIERVAAPSTPLGYVVVPPELWGTSVWVLAAELLPGTPWVSVAPAILRALRDLGIGYAANPTSAGSAGEGDPARCERLVFGLGAEHPLYRAMPDTLRAAGNPYAWYLRVADLPAFLTHVAPVLDDRLAASAAAGWSGELRLNFYTGGLRLGFVDGRLTEAMQWPEATREDASATFPPLTFLHLLWGHRSLTELEHAHADCYPRAEEGRVLIDALFPKLPSFVWPVS